MTDTAMERRAAVVGRILNFWTGVVRKNSSKMTLPVNGLDEFYPDTQIQDVPLEFDRCLRIGADTASYRVVMAAMGLQRLTEQYASATDGQEGRVPDETYDKMFKEALVVYYKAHLAIDTQTVKPGPIETLDPDYVTYRQLCRKYKIKVGELLHEVSI